jgi:multidrug resistance efflux pump
MPRSFFRTMRALDGDHRRTTLALAAAGAAMLVAWSVWFCCARVSMFVTSEQARVEAAGAVHFVDAPDTAQLVRVHTALGRRVHAGDVLFELDVAPQRLARDEEAAHVASSMHEAETLNRQIAAAADALAETQHAAEAIRRAADADRTEAASAAKLAEEERLRNEALYRAGLISASDIARARAESAAKQDRARAVAFNADRALLEQRAKEATARANVESLRVDLAKRAGELSGSRAALARSENEIGRRQVRAPVDGVVGELLPLTAGALVKQGTRLASVVPDGALQIVAQFTPASAAGRVHAGERARFRIQALGWTGGATLEARVTRVATEAIDGLVRVELQALPNGVRVPVEHGLPGIVDVETDRLSPLQFLLRTAGMTVG